MKSAQDLVEAYTAAYERVGGHPNRCARALGIAEVVRMLADDVELGGVAPLPPSVYAALLREKADDLVHAYGPAAGGEGRD